MPDEIVAPNTTSESSSSDGVVASFGFSPPEDTQEAVREALASTEASSDDASAIESEKAKAQTKPRPSATALPDPKALQALAKEGKFDELLAALEVDAEGMKIPSKRFAQLRQMERTQKAAHAAREALVVQRETDVNHRVNAVLKDYEGFAKAKAQWDDGDVVGALESAFGESLDAISDRALKQKLSSDPELYKLKRKLELKDQADEKDAETRRAAAAQRDQDAREATYVTSLQGALATSDDPTIAKAAKRPDFANQVFRAQMHIYKTEGREIAAEEAAAQVLEIVRRAHVDWSDVFGTTGGATSADSSRLAIQAENTDRAGTSPEKRRAPKGVPLVRARLAPQKAEESMDEGELLEHYKRLLRTEVLRESSAEE